MTLTLGQGQNNYAGHHPWVHGIYTIWIVNLYLQPAVVNRVEKDFEYQKFLKVIVTLTFNSG